MARRGALVRRLSAVETLGSTTVICTDKTGTLTENRMRVTTVWTPDCELPIGPPGDSRPGGDPALAGRIAADGDDVQLRPLATIASACNNADRNGLGGKPAGDPTELALLDLAAAAGMDITAARRNDQRRALFRFDPRLKLMTTIDARPDGGVVIHTKGAPEQVLTRCTSVLRGRQQAQLTADDREQITRIMTGYATRGLRVLAPAYRELPGSAALPQQRQDAEADLCLAGLVAMADPPRQAVPAAVARLHHAGILIHVVTGDNGLTAAAIASQVGVGRGAAG
jgi:magnesium-transporting ATPase (P-type)